MLRFAKRRLFRFLVSGRFVYFVPFRLRTRVCFTFHVSRRLTHRICTRAQRFLSVARPTAYGGGAGEQGHGPTANGGAREWRHRPTRHGGRGDDTASSNTSKYLRRALAKYISSDTYQITGTGRQEH